MAKFNYALIINVFKEKKQERNASFFGTLINRFKIRDTPSEMTPVGRLPVVKAWTVMKREGTNQNGYDEESKSPAAPGGVFSVKVDE